MCATDKKMYAPKKWSELCYKDKSAYMTAIMSFILGWVIAFTGLFLPPMGEISPSVLTAFGTALVYAGGIFGVALYIKGAKAEIWNALEERLEKRLGHDTAENGKQEDGR